MDEIKPKKRSPESTSNYFAEKYIRENADKWKLFNENEKLKAEVEELKKNWRDDVKLSDNAKSQMWIEFEKENGKLRELLKEASKMIDRYPNEKDCACVRCIWLEKAKEVLG